MDSCNAATCTHTTDICDATTGCIHTANTLACDDGNACTNASGCVHKDDNSVCCGGGHQCSAGKCTTLLSN
jgi:hypothetical protein